MFRGKICYVDRQMVLGAVVIGLGIPSETSELRTYHHKWNRFQCRQHRHWNRIGDSQAAPGLVWTDDHGWSVIRSGDSRRNDWSPPIGFGSDGWIYGCGRFGGDRCFDGRMPNFSDGGMIGPLDFTPVRAWAIALSVVLFSGTFSMAVGTWDGG